jgi:hypothetical protein
MTKKSILKRIVISFIIINGGFNSMVQASNKSIPEPLSWSFPDIIESARKISPKNIEGHKFNALGLVYSTEKLKLIDMKNMSADKLQVFADAVTHAYPDAISREIPESCKDIPLSNFNETAIAGLAYISVNAIESDSRNRAKNCLLEVQKKLK